MAIHPAVKAFNKILRKHKIGAIHSSTFTWNVLHDRDWQYGRSLEIDLILSSRHDKAMVKISHLYHDFPAYQDVKVIEGLMFDCP